MAIFNFHEKGAFCKHVLQNAPPPPSCTLKPSKGPLFKK